MDGTAESADETSDGSLGALVSRLGQVLRRAPLRDEDRKGRAIELRLLMSGIEEHGVDAAALIRHGMAGLAWVPVISLLIINADDTTIEDSPLDIDGWMRALLLDTLPVPGSSSSGTGTEPTDANAMSTLIDRAVHLLPTWVLEAPIQDVVTLTPPAPELLQQVTSGGAASGVTEAYRWLWERFGNDDLSKWADESLRLEFQWREQDWQPPFPLDGLTVDRASDPELHVQMAKRWVRGPDLPDQIQLLFQLQDQAIDFLTEQRYTEAAALFEFYLKQTPGDVLARNNLGFCLMPLRPEMALHHLESIRLETADNPTMTLINVCTALALLGRHGEALERAEYHWQRGSAAAQFGGAYLWRLKDDAIDLVHAPDLRLSLAHLAHGLAQHLNLPDRVRRWRERAEALGATAP